MTEKENLKKSAVVFGATGLVGKELINGLSADNDYQKITAVVRRPLSFANSKTEQVVLSDFTRLTDLKDQLHASAYFCCIGTTIKAAGSKEAFRKVDLDIPQQIARLAEALSIPALVVISSMGANASSSNFYLHTKGEMEKTLRELYSDNLKFVRPSLLMGKREEFRLGERIAVAFMKIFGWLFIGPLRRYKGISACDVACAMIKITEYPRDMLVFESDEIYDLIKMKS